MKPDQERVSRSRGKSLNLVRLTANFLGLSASRGSPTKKDSMKQAEAPAQHSKKPRNRSHLDNAKYLDV